MKHSEKEKYNFLYSHAMTPAKYGKYGDGQSRIKWFEEKKAFSNLFMDTIKNGNKILDCGCGTGGVIKYLQNISKAEFYGIDISDVAISLSNNENCYVMDISDIQFSDNEFDIVYAFDVMEHIPEEDVLESIKEQIRVTSKYLFHHTCIKKETLQDSILLDNGFDEAHITIKPLEWWKEKIESFSDKIKILYIEIEGSNLNILIEKRL